MLNVLDISLFLSVAAGALRASTPVVYAGLGELIGERSGVVNLGVEGLMLVGACAAASAQLAYGYWPLSLAIAAVAAALVSAVHGFFCVYIRTNQVVTGLATMFLCQGATALMGRSLVGLSIPLDARPPLASFAKLPVVGAVLSGQDWMVFGAIAAVVATSAFLYRTQGGIVLRACGESGASAAAVGISVLRVRLAAGAACGALCGLGGAHMSIFYAQQWQEGMVGGRGWIALVMVIFGQWFPSRLLLGAYLFGGMASLQLNLQARGVATSQYLLAMLPFLATLALLVIGSLNSARVGGASPADLGRPLEPQA
ncbi:MAG: ABC transporter permease [Vicinamibacterales bacterium]